MIYRYSKLVKGVLEEFPEQHEVQVTEDAADLRKYFLDIIYDRGTSIVPGMVLRILDLADKYEAPSLVEACRATIVSDAFKISFEPRKPVPTPGSIEADLFGPDNFVCPDDYLSHCTLADALLISSKYNWPDLRAKCTSWLILNSHPQRFESHTLLQLVPLSSEELIEVVQAVCIDAGLSLSRAINEKNTTAKCWEMSQAALKARKATELQHKKNYTKLLSKYNKLLAKARAAGIQP